MIKTKFKIYISDDLLRDSGSVRAVKKLSKGYRSFEDRAGELYEKSFLHDRIETVRGAFKKYIKQSFLVKITDWKEDGLLRVADSKIASLIIPAANEKKERIAGYFKYSEIGLFVRRAKSSFLTETLKMISIIGVAALVTNAIISIALKIETDIFGWTIRAGFTLLGITIILSGVHWEDMRDTSIFVNFFAPLENR